MWTEEKLARMVRLGETGLAWKEVARDIGIHPETVRHKWHGIATDALKRARERARQEGRMLEEVVNLDLTDWPSDVVFTEAPEAMRPELGRIPARSTYIPTQVLLANSISDGAVPDTDSDVSMRLLNRLSNSLRRPKLNPFHPVR